MTRTRRVISLVALVIVAAGAITVAVRSGEGPQGMDLVVAPHPDDEMQAWSLLDGTGGAHTVFAFMTRGEETTLCRQPLPGLDVALGEAVPDPRPRGRWTASCAQARMNSTVAFLEQMGHDDPALPEVYDSAVSPPLGDMSVGERCDDGDCHDSDNVLVHAGNGAATVLFFDLGDGDLTTDEVTAAISTVVDRRSELGLPDLPWRRLIAASYYNADQPSCFEYPHPDHHAVGEAVDTSPHSFDERYVATCNTPETDTANRVVDPDVWDTTFAIADDGTRIGPHQVLYGWLLSPFHDPNIGTQAELFHRDQHFIHHSSND